MKDTDSPMEVESKSPDFKTELAAKLQELVPEAIADGKVDTQKLKELLDEDTADDSERFGLFWPGKKRAMRAAQEPTTATLKPAKDESKDWDTTENLFIEGDNLEVLKVLQKHYHNKIKMIYIDPPYNTGKDFVYPDNYKEGLASYLEFTNQIDSEGRKLSTNSDTDGRYHSNWLNMMYPRLKLARNLLTDDGVIFVSIDDNEQDNFKKIANEIFGESNFVAELPTIMNLKGNNDQFGFAGTHEYTLVYARNIQKLTLNEFSVDEDAQQDWIEDEKGFYKKGANLKATGVNAPREKRPNLFFPLYINEELKVSLERKDGFKEVLPITDGKEMSWRWSKNKFSENLDDLIVTRVGVDFSIYKKQRPALGDLPTAKPKSIFYKPEYSSGNGTSAVKSLFNGEKHFDNPKPVQLLQDFLQIGSSADGIVMDLFAGSGTIAHAVYLQNALDGGNRKYIQIQLPEPINDNTSAYTAGFRTVADIAIERTKRAAEKIRNDFEHNISTRTQEFDAGFKVFKLADSNFTKWRTDSDVDKDSLQQHLLDIRESSNDAASEEDLLTEVLLKQGISLTAPLKHTDIEGLSTWIVGESIVAAYLNEHQKPTIDQLRAIVATEPAKFIILEDAFQGDDELKTNLVQMCKSQKIELWTV